jgi:hypothetical protein
MIWVSFAVQRGDGKIYSVEYLLQEVNEREWTADASTVVVVAAERPRSWDQNLVRNGSLWTGKSEQSF